MSKETEPSITFRGKTIPISALPKEITDLLDVHGKWEEELSHAKIEVFKLEAAIRGISIEIDHRLTELTKAG